MDMIKKLHRQFILLATLAVFIIIAVALSVINGMMYLIVRGDIHDVLETIADNGGVITTRRISGDGWLPDGSWSRIRRNSRIRPVIFLYCWTVMARPR